MINAEEVIRLQKRLESADGTFRWLWQDTAEYIFPRESNITTIRMPGEQKTRVLYDTTAVTASEDMTSGLLTNMVPAGQKFFSLTTSNTEIQEIDIVKSYMARATEVLHEELFSSNYILQLAETLHSLIVFGTACLFTEWDAGLNFMDWDVSRYQIWENSKGIVDGLTLKFPYTALQATERWGDRAGESIATAMKDPNKQQERFWFIHIVRLNKQRNPRLEDFSNMPFESGFINVKDKIPVEEGGFPEFPYMIPRWAKTSGEVHGRGIGTMILPQVKMVNANKRDFNEVGNKYANPHREVLEEFEGEYITTPGARNDVMTLPSSRVDERQFGNFPICKESLTMERQVIVDAFYADAFAPITSTGTGDRRGELEIQQRIREAFRKIGSPIGRLESELFTPQITRCFMLLVRNGVIPEPPSELQGQNLKIMYKGPLSLAQQDSEVRASQQWVGAILEAEGASPSFAGASDHINIGKTVRRWGRVAGVNEDDIATEDEVLAKREQRQKDADQRRALEAAKVAGQAYGQTTKAPEAGSAAAQMQEVAG